MSKIKKAVYGFLIGGSVILGLNIMVKKSEENLYNTIEESAFIYSENAYDQFENDILSMSKNDREYFYAMLTINFYNSAGESLCNENISITTCANKLINEPEKFDDDKLYFYENVKNNIENMFQEKRDKDDECEQNNSCI